MAGTSGYELIDFGEGTRLERFGSRLVARPFAGAFGRRELPSEWPKADLRFQRGSGWTPDGAREPWDIAFEGLTLELRPTDSGQVGLFPEHAAMLPWLRDRIVERPVATVLHLFGYTGLITLGMAAAGAAVTHVDGSRPTVAWARRNAAASELSDRPIRWIVDDAFTFTQRETRRARRFSGVVLDPPTYGHGGNRAWHADDDLATLLGACRAVLEPDGFLLLTAHARALDPDRLRASLARAVDAPERSIASGVLRVPALNGATLDLGAFARWPAGDQRASS